MKKIKGFSRGRSSSPAPATPSTATHTRRKESHYSQQAYIAPQCPYCGSKGELNGKKWECPSCLDVSVGTYDGSQKPLGILADKETRQWRMRAHDELLYKWEDGETVETFYGWIGDVVKKEHKQATIANLNAEECKQLIRKGREELYHKRYSQIFTH